MKRSVNLLPRQRRQFIQLGERLKLARLRRRLSATLVAERAGISRATLHKIELGDPMRSLESARTSLQSPGMGEKKVESCGLVNGQYGGAP